MGVSRLVYCLKRRLVIFVVCEICVLIDRSVMCVFSGLPLVADRDVALFVVCFLFCRFLLGRADLRVFFFLCWGCTVLHVTPVC